ncbi:MAG: caspase family protein [Pseudonocardia sp.]|nr:MAG: caspase family protein [Pseudonocardia sp.]
MTRRSLHIGMNYVDPQRYGGWNGALAGCVNDANAMRDVAVSRGFTPVRLLDGQATMEAVREELNDAAAELGEDDFFFLTYSGHGGQVPDENDDEPDRYDETWCLFDTELVDDSLYGALCTFKPGVRIFVLSDSCHSETVTRAPRIEHREELAAQRAQVVGAKVKQAPRDVTVAEFESHRDAYKDQSTWWDPKNVIPTDADAKVVLISGCRDYQTSMDGPTNGAFTGAFLQVWSDGNYRGNYNDLKDAVVAQVDNSDQIPCIFSYGVDVKQMLPQIPLSDEIA